MAINPPTAPFVRHQALPGKRDEVRRIWDRHVRPRAEANPTHLAYYFCHDDADPDVVCVFQLYADEAAVKALLGGAWYQGYLAEVGGAAGPPQLTTASLVWAKPQAASGSVVEAAVVRPEQPGDAGAVHAVHAESFPSAGEARLVDLLRSAGRLPVSLVAEVDGAVVGHIAFSPVTVVSGAVGAGLAPLAVTAPHRRRGIAADLVRAGLLACRSAGSSCWGSRRTMLGSGSARPPTSVCPTSTAVARCSRTSS